MFQVCYFKNLYIHRNNKKDEVFATKKSPEKQS